MKKLTAGIRDRFLAGVVVIVPVVVTILALRFLFRKLDAFLGPAIAGWIGLEVPGLGLLATILLVLVVGVVARNYAGKRMITSAERMFTRVPMVRKIYNASKDIVESATPARRQMFRDVVMLEHPRRGVYSYGFVTSYTVHHAASGDLRLANVFIPGPPLPTTGILVAVPVSDLFYLDISIEEALKLVLSVGMASPAHLRERPAREPGPDPEKPEIAPAPGAPGQGEPGPGES